MARDADLVLVNEGQRVEVINGTGSAVCPSHQPREVVLPGPYLRVLFGIVFTIRSCIDATDVSAPHGDLGPLAMIPLRQEHRKRAFPGRNHQLDGQCGPVFRTEGQFDRAEGDFSVILFTEYRRLHVVRLRRTGPRDVVFELTLHPLSFFLPLLHGGHRHVLRALVEHQGSGKRGMEGIWSKSGGNSPVRDSQSLNVSSRNDTRPLLVRSGGRSRRIVSRLAFRLIASAGERGGSAERISRSQIVDKQRKMLAVARGTRCRQERVADFTNTSGRGSQPGLRDSPDGGGRTCRGRGLAAEGRGQRGGETFCTPGSAGELPQLIEQQAAQKHPSSSLACIVRMECMEATSRTRSGWRADTPGPSTSTSRVLAGTRRLAGRRPGARRGRTARAVRAPPGSVCRRSPFSGPTRH